MPSFTIDGLIRLFVQGVNYISNRVVPSAQINLATLAEHTRRPVGNTQAILSVHKLFAMTYKVCVNILGVAIAFAVTSLSSRISEEIRRGEILTTSIRLLHLFSFGTWMGMQFWVTFIAGE